MSTLHLNALLFLDSLPIFALGWLLILISRLKFERTGRFKDNVFGFVLPNRKPEFTTSRLPPKCSLA